MMASDAKKGNEKYLQLMKESFEELDRDLKEEGNTWTVAKKHSDVVVKQTYKKGKGAEIPCYKATGILPCTPKDLLHSAVLHTENIKVFVASPSFLTCLRLWI